MEIRNACIICGCDKLEFVYSFSSFPVYMGISDYSRDSDDIFEDMTWVICERCGCIQLKILVDLDVLYHKGHNSAYGKMWKMHHERMANLVNKYGGCSILEVGGGNLKLANLVVDKRDNLRFTVYDSKCEISNKQNIVTKDGFFDYNNYDTVYEIDTIVHSHVLEHFYDPVKYMQMFAKILKNGQRMIMSVPLLDVMVKENFTNSINFEHTYMLSEDILYFIIANTGFKVIYKELFNPYNIFLVCEKVNETSKNIPENSYEKNLSLFTNFVNFHEKFVSKVNRLDCDGFYVFGGHIFSQYLFMFGLDVDRCIYVLDNDPNKIGKRLYGTNVMVKSPKILSGVKNPIVILRAAQFSDEIEEDILTNINSETIIIK